MKLLKEYYDGWKNKAWKICVAIWVVLIVVFYLLNSCISILAGWIVGYLSLLISCDIKFVEYVLTMLIDFAAPTSISIGVYFWILKYVNEKGWKKRFPQYDIDGEWHDITKYTKGLSDKGWMLMDDKKIPSPVLIKQTCNSITINTSIGDKFEWHSLLADWEDSDTIRIFYRVDYYADLQKKGYPENRVGYERMTIDRRNLAAKEKPKKMVGKFWHCLADDGKPVYMGDVTYTRESAKN